MQVVLRKKLQKSRQDTPIGFDLFVSKEFMNLSVHSPTLIELTQQSVYVVWLGETNIS